MIRSKTIAWLLGIAWIGPAYGGGCNAGLSTRVTSVDIARPSALEALLQFGYETGVCLAVESPGLDLVGGPVKIQVDRPAVAYVIQTLLEGKRYRLSEGDGVILIRNMEAVSRTSQLDVVIPEFKIPRISVSWANLAVIMRLRLLADPSIQGVIGSFSDRFPYNQVGPMEELGRTARELLTLIVGHSSGGAWVSRKCLDPVTASTSACWDVLPYVEEPDSFSGMIHDQAARIIAE